MRLSRAVKASGTRARWRDLREWLSLVDRIGELRVIRGASSEADVGAVTEMLDHTEHSPCVLFDGIPGFRDGYRVAVNTQGTIRRQAITLGIEPAGASHEGLMARWRDLLRGHTSLPPREVASGPILENVQRGEGVDLTDFPAPVWHPKDGGRFIGTASVNLIPDPDSAWINAGTYRNQVFDRKSIGIWISPGKHGRMLREKWFARGERCPIVVLVGHDPLLFMAACAEGILFGESELAWVGGVRGEPLEVIRGEVTGLPIPAQAEIALEGFIEPGELHPEGPYGEWMGYYASGSPQTPVVHVERVYHRNDPIILGCPQGKPPHEDNRFLAYLKSALAWDQIEKAGVPNVTGVWMPPVGGNRLMIVVAITQSYPGHARQAALIASQCAAAVYMGRYVVVVDDDIDIANMDDVLWAMTTRVDPTRDIEIIHGTYSGPLDAALPPEDRATNSRAIIDATKPYAWRDRFAEPIVTPEHARETRRLWSWILDPKGQPPAELHGIGTAPLQRAD
jgi:4-hydroxy-3-polyprenylbenzoate decarboxylase